MAAFPTRLRDGNTRSTSEIYNAHKPGKGKRRNFRRLLQWYADIVIAPKIQRHPSKGQLDSHRLYAAQCVICERPSIALDLAQMAKGAPRELPFEFTALDAWRIAVDQMHTRRRLGGGV